MTFYIISPFIVLWIILGISVFNHQECMMHSKVVPDKWPCPRWFAFAMCILFAPFLAIYAAVA